VSHQAEKKVSLGSGRLVAAQFLEGARRGRSTCEKKTVRRKQDAARSVESAVNNVNRAAPSLPSLFALPGSNRSGVRQLYVMPAEGGAALPITGVERGHAAMWAYWQAKTKR
jgi:hypothetical protein